jgi:hypothetical protein
MSQGDELLTEAMSTGSEAGTPGERAAIPPDDPVAAAVEDDAPLPAGVLPEPASDGGDDSATPEFREPEGPGA